MSTENTEPSLSIRAFGQRFPAVFGWGVAKPA